MQNVFDNLNYRLTFNFRFSTFNLIGVDREFQIRLARVLIVCLRPASGAGFFAGCGTL
jgi:hypothetical protein